MNFAHIAGDHNFETSTQLFGHLLSSWMWILLAMFVVLAIIFVALKYNPISMQKEKTKQ